MPVQDEITRPMGKVVRAFMDYHGESARSLAKKSGMSREAISKLEAGETGKMRGENLQRVARVLNTTPGQIWEIMRGAPYPWEVGGEQIKGPREELEGVTSPSNHDQGATQVLNEDEARQALQMALAGLSGEAIIRLGRQARQEIAVWATKPSGKTQAG